MTVRTDITVNWGVSPRIITVLSPSVEITIQDLLDTCREFEDDPQNMVYDALAEAAGKENLGGGVKVGITMKLLNAVLAFEARPGSTYVQCRVSGGNLVAVDEFDADISPIYPTAFTQVLTTASSSATIQEQTDIQYSSFNGAVHVDLTSPYPGTTFPTGTPRQRVNNWIDALAIAAERGFSNFHVMGTVTIDSGLDYTGKNFYGESQTKTVITIDTAAQVYNCEFYDATIQGILDGGVSIKQCNIIDLNYINGFIYDCILSGTITLAGDAHLINCWSGIPGTSTPIIDFNGSNSALALRNYNGGIKLINKTQPEPVSIDLNSGQIIIDSTVTDGSITCRGVGKITNNATGTAIIDSTYLMSPPTVAKATWDEAAASHTLTGSMGEAIANAGLTPEQAKQLLIVFINSL